MTASDSPFPTGLESDSPSHRLLVVRRAGVDDAAALHAVAAETFALACPPGTRQSDIDEFVTTQLSEGRMAGYLSDPNRELFIAEIGGEPVGYTMLVYEEPNDPDVAAAITARPTVELSKCYVVGGQHGRGIAPALIAASIESVRHRGAAGVWLGVNQRNARANGFYEKSGFRIVGNKKFLVGTEWHDDYTRELLL